MGHRRIIVENKRKELDEGYYYLGCVFQNYKKIGSCRKTDGEPLVD